MGDDIILYVPEKATAINNPISADHITFSQPLAEEPVTETHEPASPVDDFIILPSPLVSVFATAINNDKSVAQQTDFQLFAEAAETPVHVIPSAEYIAL